MGLRLEDDFGADFQHQSSYIAPNSFVTVGPGSGAVFGGPIVSPQMTNMLSYSEDFTNSSWVKSGVTIMGDSMDGPSGRLADTIVWNSTSGNVYQDGASALVISGMIYTFSVYLKGLSNGQIAHIGVGGDVLWKNEQITLTDSWQRYEVFGMHEKGPSGYVVRARIYPPAMSGVFVWGGQLEINPSASEYYPSLTTSATRPIEYETDCVYVPREFQSFTRNNLPPVVAGFWGLSNVVITSDSTAISPITGIASSFIRASAGSTNHSTLTPVNTSLPRCQRIVARAKTALGTFAYPPGSRSTIFNLGEARIQAADSGSPSSSGFIQNLGDGWLSCEGITLTSVGDSNFPQLGVVSYGRGAAWTWNTLSSAGEGINVAYSAFTRQLGSVPLSSQGATTGVVLEDILTTPIKSYNRDAGTIILDAYIDWGIGIGTDVGKRTIFDASADSATTDRILLQKDTTANKYNYQLFGSSGQVVSGTVTIQLSIGWHRFAATWSSGTCDLWIDGTKRIDLSGIEIAQVGAIRWGGNKFVTNEGFGAWMKNFYVYRTALSDSELTSLTGFERTGYNAYRTETIVNRTYQMWIDPTFGFDPLPRPTWGGAQNGATATISSGIIDPFGGNLAYRIQAGNAGATRIKWIYGGTSNTTINGVVTPFLGTQSSSVLNYYIPNTRSYSYKIWVKANQLSPQPRVESNHPVGSPATNITGSWSLIVNTNNLTPISVGSLVSPSFSVPTADQATGTIDVEAFNPIMDVDVGIYRETISPKSDDISISSGMVYKLKCAGNLNHGHSGSYESNYLDMGRNTTGTDYLGVDVVDSIPDGSSIVYEYFASDDDSEDAEGKWKSGIEEIAGRFFKVKVSMDSESVESSPPEVLSIKPRPRFA